MLRNFKPADKTILVKGSTAALALGRSAKANLESLEVATIALDTEIARVEDVKAWLDKNCAGDRGLLGEIEVSHEMTRTMRMCARLHEKQITKIEKAEETMELELDNTHERLADIRSLIARLSDQTELSIEEARTRKKNGRKERPGGND